MCLIPYLNIKYGSNLALSSLPADFFFFLHVWRKWETSARRLLDEQNNLKY